MRYSSALLAVSGLATIASAYHGHQHQGHKYYGRDGYSNATAAPEMVTATIYSTQLVTVTSCAPTVTYCPAHSTAVVTSVVAVSTTVCPASEASKYTSPTLSPTMPPATFNYTPSNSTAVAPITPSVSVSTGSATLTYTIGSGSSTTVVTTTVQMTSTITNTVTDTITLQRVTQTGAGGADEPTTIIKSTSTKYVTQTVPAPGSSTTDVSPQGTQGSGQEKSTGCPPPATVTVTQTQTQAPVTVTVAPVTVTTTYTPTIEPTHGPYAQGNSTTSCVGSTGFITMTGGGSMPSGYRKRLAL
ncbi:MAG: hypothetical protein M1814_003769 [Vezdaea aestivalis]|nr:MAG: hypothetical protein M1814_003769 [Vezdaea aestivalis]